MMRTSIIVLLLLLSCAITSVAMPAKPGWQTITQSDGSTLTLQAVGNAFNNAILTTDGLTVERGRDGDFYYTSTVTGMTAVRAHDPNMRTASEAAFVNAQRGAMTMQVKSYRMPGRGGQLNAVGNNNSASVPALGQRRIPIILVEFQDKKFANSRERIIESMLTGPESVGQYFRDQSNGLYQPVFDVYGIYCLSQNREYYGGRSGTGKDKGIGWLITEACELASAEGVSFSPYDTNNDYYCDVVIVIFAGVGEAQASMYHPEAIWPCNWTLDAAKYYSRGGNGAFAPTPNDPYINHFAVFNELHGSNDNGKTIDGIGTFCHEFGHCLGLPDMYDTGGRDHYGMGNWDIMCQGCYNNDGYTPVGYTAYEKHFMGWVKLIPAVPNTYYTLPVWNQNQQSTDQAVMIVSGVNKNEYFILENRRNNKTWDRYLPDEGILITHITYSAGRWTNNNVNNEDVQLITFVPADNKLSKFSESGDLWPNGYKNEWTDESTPAAQLYMTAGGTVTGNAGMLGKPVTEMVINPDGTASFWFMKEPEVKPVISVTQREVDFATVMVNSSSSLSLTVKGLGLTGDVRLTLEDATGAFAVTPLVISAADAEKGSAVTVTFSPNVANIYHADVTLSSDGAEDVVVHLKGMGKDYHPGDVDHDGSVTISDVTVLVDYLLGTGNGICPNCADLDKDSLITVADLSGLIDMLLN